MRVSEYPVTPLTRLSMTESENTLSMLGGKMKNSLYFVEGNKPLKTAQRRVKSADPVYMFSTEPIPREWMTARA
jgi:hypothetical protein